MFRISVIIPVYNACRFVAQAVASALAQAETAEVLLIEDGSSDGSLDVCRRLVAENERVRLLVHGPGENRGASASRNLGVRSVRSDYVAFLDADDFYLDGRFEAAGKIIKADSAVDGVYDAVGTQFDNEEARAWWRRYRGDATLTTVREHLPPEELFTALFTNRLGLFCTDGIVLRRSLLERVGAFSSQLKMAEDTFVWLKCAAVGRLVGGVLDRPVAMRRVHGQNSIIRRRGEQDEQARRMYELLWQWIREQSGKTAEAACVGSRVLQDRTSKIRGLRGLAWRWRSLAIVGDLIREAGPVALQPPLSASLFAALRHAVRLPTS